ncbi:MAG: serine/threonine-protein kinase [Acidobacteriota bacterium]
MAIAGRYEIVSPLGRGGMARVFRARDLVLGREVALKVLDGNARAELATRFAREGRAIARLDHASCVRILDCGPRFLVMELVAGATLAQAIAGGPLDEPRVRRITRAALSGLAHAHARGVLHRDVKPANVMLAGARVVLIDFGLACLADEASTTAVGSCFGTPSYLAPERLLGRPYDARADLYAVGVMLYEMLAGAKPFAGATPEATMQLALQRPPRPLRALRPGVSPALEQVVTRALAKDPARRFGDAEEMLSAIEDSEAKLEHEHEHEHEQYEYDHNASSTVAMIVQRSWWSRVWSRLRYGRWRWA